jgi:hypothetical protein
VNINHPAKRASLNVKRSLHWPLPAPVTRAAMVIIFAGVLGAVISLFGQLRPQFALWSQSQAVGQLRNEPALPVSQPVGQRRQQAALSPPSPPQPAPMALPVTPQIREAPANVSHRQIADAGAPALAPSPGGRDLQVAPAEQPTMPPGPKGCSTQTYSVPSESGGQVSVKVLRC